MEDLGQDKIAAENTKLRPVITGMLAAKDFCQQLLLQLHPNSLLLSLPSFIGNSILRR
jgi:hypothetical protein